MGNYLESLGMGMPYIRTYSYWQSYKSFEKNLNKRGII